MDKLLTTLEAQHRAMERMVLEIDVALTARDAGAISERLQKLKAALFAHVALENGQFYPAFESAERTHQASAQVARLFAQNMRLIADGLTGYFRRYGEGPIELARFEKEWRATVQILKERIASEEKTLHPMFQSLVA